MSVEEDSEKDSESSYLDEDDKSDSSHCPEEESLEDKELLEFQQLSLSRIRKLIKMQPKRYIGVPDDRMSIIALLAYKLTNLSGKLSAKDVIVEIGLALIGNNSVVNWIHIVILSTHWPMYINYNLHKYVWIYLAIR